MFSVTESPYSFLKIFPENPPFFPYEKKSEFSVYFSCKTVPFLLEYLCYVT